MANLLIPEHIETETTDILENKHFHDSLLLQGLRKASPTLNSLSPLIS